MVGEIYLANIYFTDASSSKIRPILILKPNSFGDLVFLPLTTSTSVKGVIISNNNLKEGYLPKSSIVVYEKPGVIAVSLLIKKLGALNDTSIKQILRNLCILSLPDNESLSGSMTTLQPR